MMVGLGLILGHLVGDYVVQNDWMARWKAAAAGVTTPGEDARVAGCHGDARHHAVAAVESWAGWRPFAACTVHCTLYTLSVWAFSFWWMPWWGLLVCFLLHWPVDRFRLAKWWMVNVSGQVEFATGPLAPWSVIVADNVFHLLTLFAIAALAMPPWAA